MNVIFKIVDFIKLEAMLYIWNSERSSLLVDLNNTLVYASLLFEEGFVMTWEFIERKEAFDYIGLSNKSVNEIEQFLHGRVRLSATLFNNKH